MVRKLRGRTRSIFGTTLTLKFESADEDESGIVVFSYMGDSYPKLKLYYNDERMDIEMTEIDYSPAF